MVGWRGGSFSWGSTSVSVNSTRGEFSTEGKFQRPTFKFQRNSKVQTPTGHVARVNHTGAVAGLAWRGEVLGDRFRVGRCESGVEARAIRALRDGGGETLISGSSDYARHADWKSALRAGGYGFRVNPGESNRIKPIVNKFIEREMGLDCLL